jgi:hypothetical protein
MRMFCVSNAHDPPLPLVPSLPWPALAAGGDAMGLLVVEWVVGTVPSRPRMPQISILTARDV